MNTFGATLLGAVMLVAGLGKLLQDGGLRATLAQYGRVFGMPQPAKSWSLLADSLPWLQLFAGALLMRGLAIGAVAPLVALLLAAFVGVQVLALRKGQRLECGCFGLLVRGSIGPTTIARDSMLALVACAVAVAAH